MNYDRRYGWRGPIAKISIKNNWFARLNRVRQPVGIRGWRVAVVLYPHELSAELGFTDGSRGTLPFAEMSWARNFVEWGKRGEKISTVGEALKAGDVILVEEVRENLNAEEREPTKYPDGTFSLRQIPAINGAVVAMDPHTGRVLSMVGGFDYAINQYNRVVQARRQPGSAFKPFVYLAALDNGYTPSTMILDAPFVIDQGPGLGKWKPANYTRKFYGPSPHATGGREVAQLDDGSVGARRRNADDCGLCSAIWHYRKHAATVIDGAWVWRDHPAATHVRLRDAGQWR